MAIEYSNEALRLFLAQSTQQQRQGVVPVVDAISTLIMGGDGAFKQPAYNRPAPDLPFPNGSEVTVPTTPGEADTYRVTALKEYIAFLRAQGLPDEQIKEKTTPFQEVIDRAREVGQRELLRRGVSDVESSTIESDIAFCLGYFASRVSSEPFTVIQLLNQLRLHEGRTLDDMGELLGLAPSRSRGSTVGRFIHRTDSEVSFRGYAQFLQGLSIESRSFFASLFATQLAIDLYKKIHGFDAAEPIHFEIISYKQYQKAYRNLPNKPQSLGEFIRYLRENSNKMSRPGLQEDAGVDDATIQANEAGNRTPYPETLVRILSGMNYEPGSFESIFAIQLALEHALVA